MKKLSTQETQERIHEIMSHDEDPTVPDESTSLTERTTMIRVGLLLRAYRARCMTIEARHGDAAYPEIVERTMRTLQEVERMVEQSLKTKPRRQSSSGRA